MNKKQLKQAIADFIESANNSQMLRLFDLLFNEWDFKDFTFTAFDNHLESLWTSTERIRLDARGLEAFNQGWITLNELAGQFMDHLPIERLCQIKTGEDVWSVIAGESNEYQSTL